jgi:hypothetical protein
MAAATTDLVDVEVYWQSKGQFCIYWQDGAQLDFRSEHPIHLSYQITDGLLQEEAVLILRRFYIKENGYGRLIHCYQFYCHSNWYCLDSSCSENKN